MHRRARPILSSIFSFASLFLAPAPYPDTWTCSSKSAICWRRAMSRFLARTDARSTWCSRPGRCAAESRLASKLSDFLSERFLSFGPANPRDQYFAREQKRLPRRVCSSSLGGESPKPVCELEDARSPALQSPPVDRTLLTIREAV